MSSPSACPQCSRIRELLTPSGICRECAATNASALPTPATAATPLAPDSRFPPPPTHIVAPEVRDNDITRTLAPERDTATVPLRAPRPLPESPPGFQLIREIGHGGMGEVFLALDETFDREIAIKLVRNPSNPENHDRFLLELRTLARLEHPNLVRIFTADIQRSVPFFTMEYLAGGSVGARIKAPKSEPRDSCLLSVADTLRIIRQVANAIQFAHSHGFVHRDLKPSNIFLAEDGTAKVGDFGLVKQLSTPEGESPTLGTGILGTANYMPPEQISSKNGEIGCWSDVYGLGATLYHMLTGRPPFEGATPDEIIVKVLNDTPSRVRSLKPEISLSLEAIVMKCLAKDTNDRYQTVAEFLADLDKYEAGLRPAAPRLTRPYRAKLWAKRNRVGVAVAVALVAGLTTGALAIHIAKPVDHVAKYHRDLKAGKPVVLIPKTGVPAWSQSPVGAVDVSAPLSTDGACLLQSMGHHTLMVLPSVPIDNYTVEAEFSYRQFAGAPANAVQDKHQWYGLLLGYDITLTPKNERMHSFFAISFSDYDIGFVPPQNRVCCAANGILEQRGENPEPFTGFMKHRYEFTAGKNLPGKWRAVKYEVSPTNIKAFWWDDEKLDEKGNAKPQWVKFADLDQDDILACVKRVDDLMAKYQPPLIGQHAGWSPRRGIAIGCSRSSVAVRNVVITPSNP